jgi:pimeloyl-ACP methyl ester carboxylesterase
MWGVNNIAAVRFSRRRVLAAAPEGRVEEARIVFQAHRCKIAAASWPGAAPPVLFLHGNSSSKRIWMHQFRCLKAIGRGFIAIDLPGHGESENSPVPDITYSFPGYADIVRSLLDELCLPAVDVVGWSLGGHVGLELLATDTRVRSLLLIGAPPARPRADVLQRVFHSSASLDYASRQDLSERDIESYAAAMLGGSGFVTEEVLQDIRRTDGLARKCMFENVLRGVGTDEQVTVETSPKPLCVVHGACEAFVRLDYLRSLRYHSLCDGKIHIVQGAGHAPHWQYPAAFNPILLRFLTHHAPAVLSGTDAAPLRAVKVNA